MGYGIGWDMELDGIWNWMGYEIGWEWNWMGYGT
jgi:hypothetical protein